MGVDDLEELIQETRDYLYKCLKKHLYFGNSLLKGMEDCTYYSLFSGGKLIRPIFCFLIGEMYNIPRNQLSSLACAVEMIHTSSLIMDDFPYMDNSRKRRGKLATHIVYGQDTASLVSIGLLAKAFEVILSDKELPDDKKIKVSLALSQAVGINGMTGGQYADLKAPNHPVDVKTLKYIHSHKTASLFVACCEGAAIIAGASNDEINAIRSFAGNLGFAYQINDDISDVTNDEMEVGKSLQKDKFNFAALVGINEAKNLLKKYTNDAMTDIRMFDGKNNKILTISQMLLGQKA